MNDWMRQLATHYDRLRRHHPDDRLLIVFDIDGTIIDTEQRILAVLQAYDREHDTDFFLTLRPSDLNIHQNQVPQLLNRLAVPDEHRNAILEWYGDNNRTSRATMSSHRPYRGVLEVIRWFQLQPNTFVGLNTGWPDELRAETLHSLNALGREYRVSFTSELLYMNPGEWDQDVSNRKVRGIEHFQTLGYRVVAYVDSDPENLRAVAQTFPDGDILLLQADTIHQASRRKGPRGAVRGKKYDLTELISEKALPQHIQFVWHGINDQPNLRQFLASEIHWAEIDVRRDARTSKLILRHDGLDDSELQDGEMLLDFSTVLKRIREANRAAKIDFKENGLVLDAVLNLVSDLGFPDDHLWFNGNVERIREEGFRQLAAAHPGAILQCPVDFLAPLIIGVPDKAREILELFRSWGINRFSLGWRTPDKRQVFDQMDAWGYEVNIYDVPDLENFLQATLLVPRSITSDFNFPKWHYYGRGSGEKLERVEYDVAPAKRKR